MTEYNLSSKIIDTPLHGRPPSYIKTKDVKDFINLLMLALIENSTPKFRRIDLDRALCIIKVLAGEPLNVPDKEY